jgi:hypothetical protein
MADDDHRGRDGGDGWMNRRRSDKLIVRIAPVVGYLIVVGALLWSVTLQRDAVEAQRKVIEAQRQATLRSSCEVLDHRVGSRESFRTIIGFLRAIALAAANDPDDVHFRETAEQQEIPPLPEPSLLAERKRICTEAGINDLYRVQNGGGS